MNSKKKRFLFLAIITFLFCFRWVTNAESAITKVGQWGSGPYTDVFIDNSYAYCAAAVTGIDIFDISDQANPVLVSSFDTLGETCKVHVSGNYLYAASYTEGLKIIDISNPSSPTLKGSYDTSGLDDVCISDNYAYVTDTDGLKIIDISNPASPSLTGSYDTGKSADGVYISGNYAYIAVDFDGLKIIDISNPASPSLTGSYDTERSDDVYISGNYAYIAGYEGLKVINISNPASPALTGSYDTEKSAAGVYISGNYAYIAVGSDGLEIIDISNPASPSLTGSYDIEWAKDVYISGNYAYIADYFDGLKVVDISNPVSPSLTGSYDISGNTKGVYVSGNYAYLADDEDGLRVVDISNPSSPALKGSYDTSENANGVYVSGNYAYVTDTTGGLKIIDISNPASPSLTGSYDTSGDPSPRRWDTPFGAYNVHVSGNYAYLACGDGLKVINISNPASPSLTGSYDSPKIGDVSMPAYDVHVSGNYAYVVFAADGLRIIDISNPASPSPTGHYNNVLIAKSVHVSGNYAYLTNPGHDDGDLLIIDISNPASPSLAGSYYAPGFVTDAYVSGSCVYVTDPLFGVNNSGLQVVDISNPATPAYTDSYKLSMNSDVYVSGNHTYLANDFGRLVILDLGKSGSESGSVKVTISPQGAVDAGAQWQADGGAWQNSGTVVSDLSAGSHTVSFKTVGDWTAPPDQTVTVSSEQTASVTGTYTEIVQTGSLKVTISPQDAIDAGAQWQTDSGAWQNSGTVVPDLGVGTHTVTFKTTDGWTAPPDQTVNVSSGQTVNVTGTYTEIVQTGSLKVAISPQGAADAGAQWQVDSGSWQDSGTVVSDLGVGTHTVTFKTTDGWTAPPDQTVNVGSGQTVNVTGTYTEIVQTGSLKVTISPQGATDAGAQWQTDSGSWQDSGTVVSDLDVGTYTVFFKTADGWTAPPDQTVSISADVTEAISGTYTKETYTLADAIVILQMLCGVAPNNSEGYKDANSDGKAGLEDVAYILQSVLEVR